MGFIIVFAWQLWQQQQQSSDYNSRLFLQNRPAKNVWYFLRGQIDQCHVKLIYSIGFKCVAHKLLQNLNSIIINWKFNDLVQFLTHFWALKIKEKSITLFYMCICLKTSSVFTEN